MKAGRTFFRMECKRYFQAVPAILLESILFGLLILSFGIFAARYVYGNRTIGTIRVGIVSEEEDELSRMLVKFVSSMDSMEESCSFELMDEAKARRELEDGSIYAAIILPRGMFDGIMNGENIPATVLFSTSYSRMEADVFRELAGTGSRLLTAAQAGIYAADDLCLKLEKQDWIQATEDYLNKAYLDYALNRTSVFKLEEVNAAGSYSLIQYYGTSLLLVFLSFAGLIMGKSAGSVETSLSKVMSARGYSKMRQLAADAIAFSVVFSLFGEIAGVLFWQLAGRKIGFHISLSDLPSLFFLFLSMGIFIRILIGITGNNGAGIGVAFLILLVMMTAAGLLIPQAFLPETMERIGKYLPYRIWLEAALEIAI